MNVATSKRRVAIIVSHGGLDEVYPGLILGNAARQSGIDAFLFFTFWGLDAITESKVDHLHMNLAGNASSNMPTVLAGLPGMESLAASMMKKQMAELDLPTVREMMQILDESGAELFACELAMKMFKREGKDLLPQVKDVITAGDFYDLAEGAQIIFT
ncbi:MAG: DsrE/DsrF/DrsH-like family protein [Myxococcales bacterium]|jgi:peroxiredoxin family protein|nr:DsrE/DsrF/DrsH-like family protein [Myxococcales bacterium]MBL0198253.1 DsrE/DsrF/DrsH-like family protein [Myxococcales bacterium]HQY62695.1 DsrE/DsrF/DrsH-like family protein [Polyangiaceae bacterium]